MDFLPFPLIFTRTDRYPPRFLNFRLFSICGAALKVWAGDIRALIRLGYHNKSPISARLWYYNIR